ncbi:MAG TPA: ABC transporter substrate-binding protein, partial [Methanospirillum sp.]|uniref:ABC transporter substrate-binding protein n=1 Tax=Methanospirillum sp. TaxID=45200 RepID=UPI002B5E6098
PVVTLVYASSGIMPQLLNTSQVDAFIVWESVVSTAEQGGIGKVIARDADIPPDHKWENSACNVLVLRNKFIAQYPEIAALLSAVTIAGMRQIQKDPDGAQNITATWVYGSKPVLSAGFYLDPQDVEKEAFKHINFTDSASLPDISWMVEPSYSDKTGENKTPSVNESVKMRAEALLNGSEPEISGKPPIIQIGYLPSSDLYAPLYVTIMDHENICDTYGFCLEPEPGLSGRPTECHLKYQNKTIAEVELMPGSVGGGIMTGLGQDAMDGGYIGSVPSLLQISMGNEASIIQSINAGGTGLVVDDKAPCTDWSSFITWIKTRSAQNQPVILAVPQSSIQEEMIREAFKYEDIQISLYGLPPTKIL